MKLYWGFLAILRYASVAIISSVLTGFWIDANRPAIPTDRPSYGIKLYPRITDSAHKGDTLSVLYEPERYGVVRNGWRGNAGLVALDTIWVSFHPLKDR